MGMIRVEPMNDMTVRLMQHPLKAVALVLEREAMANRSASFRSLS